LSGGKNFEAAVMTKEHGPRQLDEAETDVIKVEIEAEKAETEDLASTHHAVPTNDSQLECLLH